MSFKDDWLVAVKRALPGWDPSKHPRGRDGRFIEVGDLVAIFTGPDSPQSDTGIVVAGHYAPDGRFFVAIKSSSSGKVAWYRPKQIEQVKPKAVLEPTSPIPDVGTMEGELWDADSAVEAQQVQKDTLATIAKNPGKAEVLVDSISTSSADSDQGAPINAGFAGASEVAVKKMGVKATALGTLTEEHLSPAGVMPTVDNSLKAPVKITDGAMWIAAWTAIGDAGGPKSAGMGFAPNGVDLEVHDFATAYGFLNVASNSGSPAASKVQAVMAEQYKGAYPGKPVPGTVFPAPPDAKDFGLVMLDAAETDIFNQMASWSDDEPVGLQGAPDFEVSDLYQVTNKGDLLSSLNHFKDQSFQMGTNKAAFESFIAKVQQLPDKPVIVPVTIEPTSAEKLVISDMPGDTGIIYPPVGAHAEITDKAKAVKAIEDWLTTAHKYSYSTGPAISLLAKIDPGASPIVPLTDDQFGFFEQMQDVLGDKPEEFGFQLLGFNAKVFDKGSALKVLESNAHVFQGNDLPYQHLLDLIKLIEPTPDPVAAQTPGTPAPGAAPAIKLPKGKTSSEVLNAIITSADNKFGPGSVEAMKVSTLMGAALSNPSPVQAHKQLATAMTIAKLGGKQRARYKQILDMHMGVSTPVPQKSPAHVATAGDITPDKPKGLPASAALEPAAGNKYVNPGGVSAQQAKAKIQKAIAERMTDVPIEQLGLVLKGSPGINEGPAAASLVDAWGKGDFSGTMYRYSGSWTATEGGYGSPETSLPMTKQNLETAIRETAVNALISTWASTSNDNNPRSLALQDFAIEEFGLNPEWIYNWHSTPPDLAAHKAAHRDVYRRFLREMYNHTQQDFKSKGIKYVKLRRGVHSPPTKKGQGTGLGMSGNKGSIIQRPMSSYSSNATTAKGFGSYVHEGWIPVERIVGSALTGFGCQHEYEFVVLGGPNEVVVY